MPFPGVLSTLSLTTMSRQSHEDVCENRATSPSSSQSRTDTNDTEQGNNIGNKTDASSSQGANSSHKTITSKYARYLSSVLPGLGACILFIFVVYYACEALIAPNPALGALSFPPSTTLFVINVLSHITSFTLRRLVSTSFAHIRWNLLCNENGVRMLTNLALDKGTTLYGVFLLLWTRGTHRKWCLLRYTNCKEESDF
jgi:hypothetical protein